MNIKKGIKKSGMKQFTILGERCSGTHYLQYAMTFNFKVEYVRGEKHFYVNNGYDDFVEKNKDDMIFLCIVRDPIEWIDSFFKRLHHIPPENKKNIESFIRNEFYSIYEEGNEKDKEMMQDRHLETNQRYRDIFEMRKIKNDFYQMKLSKKVKNCMIMRYEDLRDKYDKTLKEIEDRFQLKRKEQGEYKRVPQYKGTYLAKYAKKPILLSNEIQYEIWEKVDVEQEKELGYFHQES